MRALLGWTATQTASPLPGGGYEIATETEWDYTERNLAVAVDEIDLQTCGGCGGDLSIELTDKHPAEDDGDGHHHRAKPLWCRRCVSGEKLRRRQAKEDEDLRGTAADPYRSARRWAWERVPNTPPPTP